MKNRAWFGIIALSSAVSACASDDDEAGTTPAAGNNNGNDAGQTTTLGGAPNQPAGGRPVAEGGAVPVGGAGSLMEACPSGDGQCIFRNDTFGDEQLWTDTLRLQEVVQSLKPSAALKLGLKVDAEAVPAGVLADADLEAPATTLALLELGAIVGVRATVADGRVERIGVTCALCHSTVDDSAAPGIGKRLDGHPNRQLDPGAIIAATPGASAIAESLGITPTQLKSALNGWGPGRYDARTNQDGESHPVLIPPAYGLADVELETYTGEGPISYWNAYVAVTQMGAQGTFVDEDLGVEIHAEPDLLTPKLDALREYQHSLQPPPAARDSFDADAAARGGELFDGAATCATCHAGPSFTDAPMLHEPEDIGAEPNEARRSKTGMYRTTPLRGVATHPPFFHDGSAETLADVVTHYDAVLELGLSASEQADLVEYLKSL